MLELLRIKNFALIENAQLEFSKGLNVITGESGAGKSIILKSLDFLLGQNVPSALIEKNRGSTFVEAIFILNDEEFIIRREISQESKRSRIYVNDKLSSKNAILELRQRLIIYTSQHEQQKLIKPEYHTNILDQFLPLTLKQQKKELLQKLKETISKINRVRETISNLHAQKELFEYQLKEIEKVSPEKNEDELLLKKREELKRSAKIGEKIEKTLAILDQGEFSLINLMGQLAKTIGDLAQLDSDFSNLVDKIEVAKDSISDIYATIRSYPIGVDQIKELEKIEERLFEIEQLKRRLNKSLDEIFLLKESLEENILKIDELNLELKNLLKQKKQIENELQEVVEKLNKKRIEVSKTLSKKLNQELLELGFHKDTNISFEFFDHYLEENIKEKRARIIWRPNPGHPFSPLENIVSGGELSRIFLALMSVYAEELPTLIFDEVDAGIGGITLTKVGKKIKELSNKNQIILITHWPQLASLADAHFMVKKEVIGSRAKTILKKLEPEEIIQELSRMAGGGDYGNALANELIQENI